MAPSRKCFWKEGACPSPSSFLLAGIWAWRLEVKQLSWLLKRKVLEQQESSSLGPWWSWSHYTSSGHPRSTWNRRIFPLLSCSSHYNLSFLSLDSLIKSQTVHLLLFKAMKYIGVFWEFESRSCTWNDFSCCKSFHWNHLSQVSLIHALILLLNNCVEPALNAMFSFLIERTHCPIPSPWCLNFNSRAFTTVLGIRYWYDSTVMIWGYL